MSLKSTIQKAVKSGFRTVGDVAQNVTYYQKGDPDRNSATREVTSMDLPYVVKAIFTDYTSKDLENSAIRSTDQKILITKLDLPVVVSDKDFIEDVDEVIWNVVNFETDPANAVWEIQGRKA